LLRSSKEHLLWSLRPDCKIDVRTTYHGPRKGGSDDAPFPLAYGTVTTILPTCAFDSRYL
jgi:hypothetical protein